MGWRSSADVTREEAIKLLRDWVDDATNEQLDYALEELRGQQDGKKYVIVEQQ